MNRIAALVALSLAMIPGAAWSQGPIAKLLDKVPSLLGNGPSQPRVVLPATPDIPAVTHVANRGIPGDASTFDLGGFRLGMSEAEVESVAGARGLWTGRVSRIVDFETQLRQIINVRGGAGGQPTKRSVLGEAELRDETGGRYMLKLAAWPDGAHLRSITYLAPQGTPSSEWQRMLFEKWGRPARQEAGADLSAAWGSSDAAAPNARAQVGTRGGQITLNVGDAIGNRPGRLVDQAADAFFASHAVKPRL